MPADHGEQPRRPQTGAGAPTAQRPGRLTATDDRDPPWAVQLRLEIDPARAALAGLAVGPYTAVRTTPEATIQQRFEDFHAANPWVYASLVALARDMLAHGRRHLGIGMLWEVLRWHYYRATLDPSGSTFKLNDHYRSRYARLICDREPDLAEVFELRALRSP